MRTITYKGYQASVEFDNGSLFVKVLHIEDVLVAECDKASEAENAAHELIDEYLKDCLELGREPAKPYKGSFNVRVSPDLHRRAAMEAAEYGCSLNQWIGLAIQEKVECSRLKDRLDGVVTHTKRRFSAHFMSLTREYWNTNPGEAISAVDQLSNSWERSSAEQHVILPFKHPRNHHA